MIVHVETARTSHAWQHTVAQEIISGMSQAATSGEPIFGELVERSIDDLERSVTAGSYTLPDSDDIVAMVREAFIKGGVVTEKVNSDNDVQALLDENAELRLRTPYNVFIGGQILDRGITVPNLLGFFYGRSPKKMQQDTVLQHARMYGNRPKEDLAVSRFYTTAGNYNALKAIHEFDSSLRHSFETGAHDRGVAFVMRDASNRVIPCAPSKILVSNIVSLRPNGALLPFGFQTRAKTELSKIMTKVDALVPPEAIDSKQAVRFKCETAVQILDLIEEAFRFEDGYSFDWEACRAAVEYFSKIASPPDERGDCWIIAPKGRTIARRRAGGRYSDAPLSYQERTAFRSLGGGLPILALLGQEGREEDGWRDCPFWWPVLVAPAQAVPSIFASSVRDNGEDDDD
jgi:hypothetical protein